MAADRDDDVLDSVAKLEACQRAASACGCRVSPTVLADARNRTVAVAPLLSWPHASRAARDSTRFLSTPCSTRVERIKPRADHA